MIKFLKPRNEKELFRCVIDAFSRIERYSIQLESELSKKDKKISSLESELATLKRTVTTLKATVDSLTSS